MTWTTIVPADSKLEYGVGGLGSTVYSGTMTTSHSLVWPSNDKQETYQYRVPSTNTCGRSVSTSGTYDRQSIARRERLVLHRPGRSAVSPISSLSSGRPTPVAPDLTVQLFHVSIKPS